MNFLLIIVKRFLAKQPKFFKVLTNVALLCAVITGLPAFLADSGVLLPDTMQALASKIVSTASLVGAIIAKLTVEDPSSLKQNNHEKNP